MTEQKTSPDLSKRQVLESIKRIVAEGESRGSATGDSAAPEAASALEVDADKGDDILDLVDVVDEQGNPIRLDRAARESVTGGHATEEQVLETLRPMLQVWLDTHMTPMVERLVKREIERASSRSEPE